LRRGRGTNSPPQFGQTLRIFELQSAQNVHSYEQTSASESIASARLHFSQLAFICSAMPLLAPLPPSG
jgi:hypothetical protein